MKTFLDRSLAFGHKPRQPWKPGLAVSVSAGSGETWVAGYLGDVMRSFGAFPVGALTSISVAPGQFVGKEAVESRAADLAADLARAVKEGRRFPATDRDLHFWRFMAYLVNQCREFMKADHDHWAKEGLYDSFEAYMGQAPAKMNVDKSEMEAYIKRMMEGQKRRESEEAAVCRESLSRVGRKSDN